MELVAQFTRCAECGLTICEDDAAVLEWGEWVHEHCAEYDE